MKRLTIHLKKVDKVNNKIHNTYSFIVKNKQEISNKLSLFEGNIKKHYLSNF